MIKTIIYTTFVIVLVLAARSMYVLLPNSGLFKDFESIAIEQCDRIEAAPGPEDIQIDSVSGLAYIAATDRRDKGDHPDSGIYVLDLNQPNSQVKKLEGDFPEGFSPHGISLWRGENGERRLFAVNHPLGKHSVEIFRFDENDRLIHLDTIKSEMFTFPNDVVAVGERQFYMSNMRRASGGISLLAETYLGLPVTDVIYFDGANESRAATGLITANGVNVSSDGNELYIAEVLPQRINIYKRNVVTGELAERERISIGTGADNIDVAGDGSLYIGAHPNLLAYLEHAKDPEAISPSQVVRLDPKTGEYETVFMAINGELDGSATGAYWNRNLVVGGVFESHIMRCTSSN